MTTTRQMEIQTSNSTRYFVHAVLVPVPQAGTRAGDDIIRAVYDKLDFACAMTFCTVRLGNRRLQRWGELVILFQSTTKPGPIIAYIGGMLEIIQLLLESVQPIRLDQ